MASNGVTRVLIDTIAQLIAAFLELSAANYLCLKSGCTAFECNLLPARRPVALPHSLGTLHRKIKMRLLN